MAVFFHSSDSDINIEVGEYQEFHRPEAEGTAGEKAPKPSKSSGTSLFKECRHVNVVLLSFGLLCVLQAILNISLRLTLSDPTEKGETEEQSWTCPQGWMMFGSSCYYISTQRQNWNDSQQYCLQRDADLVIIDSRQEQAFLTGFTRAAWVGMTDREEEGIWVWVDGTLVDMDRLQWAKGQPDDAFRGEDCGELRMEIDFIGLNDVDCDVRIQWICEKNIMVAE